MDRKLASDGTLGFLVNDSGIQMIALATGATVHYNPEHSYVAMCYSGADSLIYAATQSSIFSIAPADGTTVLIGRMEDVEFMSELAADSLLIIRGASVIDYTPSTEAVVYIRQDV